MIMAGNLTELLADSTPVQIDHRLESVKQLPQDGTGGPWILDIMDF